MTDLTLLKLALLADWQHLCHDDFDEEEDMDEDQYWSYLQGKTPEQLKEMAADDFDEERTPQFVWDLYQTYVSPQYSDLLAK